MLKIIKILPSERQPLSMRQLNEGNSRGQFPDDVKPLLTNSLSLSLSAASPVAAQLDIATVKPSSAVG